MDIGLDTRMALRESRIRFQREIYRALSCTNKKQKIKLAAEWKEKYSPTHYKELIACAKNKRIAGDILNWNLDEL
jgi:hypothetical protein